MRAIILAAGIGSRLRPMTSRIPKCLVKVNKKPIIHYQMEALIEAGVEEIVVVTGYRQEQVMDYLRQHFPPNKTGTQLTLVHNKDFRTTNNLHSLWTAADWIRGDTFIINGDVIFDAAIAKGMAGSKHSLVAVERQTYYEESMKVRVNSAGEVCNISKTIPQGVAEGVSIDIYYFNKLDAEILRESVDVAIEIDEQSQIWTEQLFNELFANAFIRPKMHDIGTSQWWEIDTKEDLLLANGLFK